MQLNRKKILIAVLVGFVIFLIAGFFLILTKQEQQDSVETTSNLFPFGEVNLGNLNPFGGRQGTSGGDGDGNGSQSSGDGDTFEEEGPRLRQISDFPTGGFVAITRTEEEDIIEVSFDDDGNRLETFRTVEVENQYVRYSSIEDASVYEAGITPSAVTPELLVENFIPNAERAFFNQDGGRVLFQYWNRDDHVPESYLARIEKIQLEVTPCPFTFSSVNLGEDNQTVLGLHQFLNRNPQTRIARVGINSPGNESSLATDATITAIKNFQSLYQIDIDGQIGGGTKAKMEEICNDQQEKLAKEAFEALDKKYRISGFFLPQNITEVAINPTGTEMFYFQEDSAGVIGVVRDLIADTKKTVFESPFTEWLATWSNLDSIEISTKPSYQAEGFSYRLDPETTRYFKSLPEEKGLTVLPSPDDAYILTSSTDNNSVRVGIYDRTSGTQRPLSIETFTDKCVWASDASLVYCGVPNSMAYGNQYPDTWYQGLENYADSLWVINAETGQTRVVSDLVSEYNESIDVSHINIDERGEYLYFTDKDTEFLWSYRLVDF